ncbi:MAG: maltose ABC transporter substrate-binding protein [Ancrocorticia sp.]
MRSSIRTKASLNSGHTMGAHHFRGRKLSVLAGLTAAALALSACGGGDTPSEGDGSEAPAAEATGEATGAPARDADADLVIWADNMRAEVIKPFAESFGEENGVKVQVQYVTDVRGDFSAAIQSGTGPDIVVGAHDWLGEFVQNGSVSPLNLGSDLEGQFNPKALEAARYEGQTYAIPYALETLALIRNKALAPEAPATLDDAIALGESLKAEGKASNVLITNVSQTGDGYHAYPFLSAYGGGFFEKTADGDYDPSKVILDSPETVKGAEIMASLGEKGILSVNIGGENAEALFTKGDVPYYMAGPWVIPGTRNAGIDYEITPMPATADGGQLRPFYTVQMAYVSAKAKNPALAEEFVLNTIASKDVQVALFNAGQRVPALTAAVDDVAKDNPEIKVWNEAVAGADLMPNIPGMNAVWTAVGQSTADIVAGKISAADGMAAAQKSAVAGLGTK